MLILFTSGLGLVVEGKMIAARHDGHGGADDHGANDVGMTYDNPLDHVEDHTDEAQDMIDLADGFK